MILLKWPVTEDGLGKQCSLAGGEHTDLSSYLIIFMDGDVYKIIKSYIGEQS